VGIASAGEARVDSRGEITAFPANPFFRFRSFLPNRPSEPQDIIVDSKLWFSSPKNFNDPYEAKPALWFGQQGRLTREHIAAMFARLLPQVSPMKRQLFEKQAIPNFRGEGLRAYRKTMIAEVKAIFEKAALCCFFKDWRQHALWAYYADCHYGYCLVFDGDVSWSIKHSRLGPFQLVPMDVQYAETYPKIYLDWRHNGGDGWDVIEKALLTKSMSWKHENEAKILVPERPSQNISFPDEYLKAILLGIRTEAHQADRICEFAKSRPGGTIPVFKVTQQNNTFELGLTVISS
jgi:hypothetical protein